MTRLLARRERRKGVEAGLVASAKPTLEDYLERVTKLIPVEIVGAYLAIRSLLADSTHSPWIDVAIFAALLALTPIYLAKVSGDIPRRGRQLAIAVGSFVLWTYVIAGGFFWTALVALTGVDVMQPALGGVALILWSLATAAFNPDEGS